MRCQLRICHFFKYFSPCATKKSQIFWSNIVNFLWWLFCRIFFNDIFRKYFGIFHKSLFCHYFIAHIKFVRCALVRYNETYDLVITFNFSNFVHLVALVYVNKFTPKVAWLFIITFQCSRRYKSCINHLNCASFTTKVLFT